MPVLHATRYNEALALAEHPRVRLTLADAPVSAERELPFAGS